MAFDESKYVELERKSLGQLNGWKGEVVMVRYKYGDNPESVKLVVTNGKYESKLISGLPANVLRDNILPALAEFVGGSKPQVVRRIRS